MLQQSQKKDKLEKARERSVKAREEQVIDGAIRIAEFIGNNPGRSLSELAKTMSWSIGKTQHVVNYAENDAGSVESRYVVEKGRNKRKFYPVAWYNRLDWNNFDNDGITDMLLEKIEKLQLEAREQGLELEIKVKALAEKLDRRKEKED